jgi:two-component system chemotaxis response regulator CheY
MKILIVDDNRAMRMIVRRHIESARLPAAEIIETGDGAVALDVIRSETPDLVVSDWDVPGVSGVELLRAARSTTAPIRFGFVASTVEPAMRAIAVDEGAHFVITRPFTAADFQAAMARVR